MISPYNCLLYQYFYDTMACFLALRSATVLSRCSVRRYHGNDPVYLVEVRPIDMQHIKTMWHKIIHEEQKCQNTLKKASLLRKELESLMSYQDVKSLHDEEENRVLTIAALRHARCDPLGEFIVVDFSQKKQTTTNKILKPKKKYEETDEDRWLTEQSQEFAKKV